jgi:hypothetical protein
MVLSTAMWSKTWGFNAIISFNAWPDINTIFNDKVALCARVLDSNERRPGHLF